MILSFVCWIHVTVTIALVFLSSAYLHIDAELIDNAFIRDYMMRITEFANTYGYSVELVEYVIHTSLFAILAIFSYYAMKCSTLIHVKFSSEEFHLSYFKSANELNILISLWLSILCAVFDEYFQLFFIHKDGQIIDVCYDAVGITTVLIIIRIIFVIKLKIKGKKEADVFA